MAEDDTSTSSFSIQERYRDAGKLTGKARKHRPQKPCRFEGCSGWAWAQGYCDNHYQKLKREGVIKSKRIVGDPVARFHASYEVNPGTGCWEWTGWIHPNGYGILVMGGKSKKVRAHRFSWELHNGPIPAGVDALHKCDNRKCCCPDHLFLGDDRANMLDCVAKGRHNSQIGTSRPKISPPMALNIRIIYARGLPTAYRTKANPLGVNSLAVIYGVGLQTVLAIVKGTAHFGLDS
jgi:hypothetical protein